MKLLRLKITDPKGFRSLQSGFEYFFRTSWELQEDKGFALLSALDLMAVENQTCWKY